MNKTPVFVAAAFVLACILYLTKWTTNSPRNVRQLEPLPSTEQALLYVWGVRGCQLMKTNPMEFMTETDAFDEYWRSLPVIVDECSVNPQMSLKPYPTSSQFSFYYIPNMNNSKSTEKCTALSFGNKEYRDQEQVFEKENPSCKLHLIPNNSEDGATARSSADVFSSFLTKVQRPISTLFIGPDAEADSILPLFFADSQLKNTVCQLNVLYPEPLPSRRGSFLSAFNRLLLDGHWLLIKAEKNFSSTHINLFLVNFHHEYCRSRYFRMYTFD